MLNDFQIFVLAGIIPTFIFGRYTWKKALDEEPTWSSIFVVLFLSLMFSWVMNVVWGIFWMYHKIDNIKTKPPKWL